LTTRAAGTFQVKMSPLSTTHGEDPHLGRMSLDKRFEGDLIATGKGEMLTAGTNVKNSAVYVAVERISGTLQGKYGSFVVHHSGVMNRGAQDLTISVVPDSGTDELTGITGTMKISIVNGQHLYELDYWFSHAP